MQCLDGSELWLFFMPYSLTVYCLNGTELRPVFFPQLIHYPYNVWMVVNCGFFMPYSLTVYCWDGSELWPFFF